MNSVGPAASTEVQTQHGSNRSATHPTWEWSREVKIMLHPAASYEQLAGVSASETRIAALRRPLFVAFLLGCMVSLIASQRLTFRHVAGGAISASCILVGQIAALAVLCGRERGLSFWRAIDLFFMGYGPWSLWILGVSAIWAFASPM